ncbi:ABC transporter permease [Methanosarcina spelaei]|jgi:ABC-2 type transport system permease protein|nr:ABC transporter permease [Methanosarcina spelaei]
MSTKMKNKSLDIKNVFHVAQKEFADLVSGSLFLTLIATYTLIIFVFSWRSVHLGEHTGSEFTLMSGFSGVTGVTRQIGWFSPLIGIALGFDTIIKERKSGSLNVLLTHPVFRDNIIAGKMLGIMGILMTVIIFSTIVPVGTILIFSGIHMSETELLRITAFIVFNFLYVLIFAEVAILLSTVANDAEDSLVYNVIIWLSICIVSGSIIIATASIVTGQSDPYELASKIITISPLHHYSEISVGEIDLSWGGINNEPVIEGVFDTRFTLFQWFNEFWSNLLFLIIAPLLLFILSFLTFLRRDISTG